MSYIDMRHRGFFPPRLTVGEAWDLGPRLIRVDSLVPTRDKSADTVFQGQVVHTSVKEQRIEVPTTKQVKVESIDSSSAKVENAEDEMVVQRNMTADIFLPGGRPATQQQLPKTRNYLLQPPVTAKGLTIPTSLREGQKRLLQGFL